MSEPASPLPPPGTRVLVTGGARGIGRAVAEAFAARGARLCILDRDMPPGLSAQIEMARVGSAVA